MHYGMRWWQRDVILKSEVIMKIAMLFPGYTSQFVGMGKELYDQHRIVQEYFEEASNCLNANLVKLCFASSDNELSKMNNAYAALFLVSSSIYKLLEQEQIKPDLVAGYNQGQYSALFAAGACSFPDGLYLLNKYTNFYQEVLNGMDVAAVQISNMSPDRMEKIISKIRKPGSELFVSVYKDTLVHIVSGRTKAIDKLRELVADYDGAKIQNIAIEVGLHSALMDDVASQLRMNLEKVDCKELAIPCISGITGGLIKTPAQVREEVISHINQPVHWTRVIAALSDYDVIIEMGPGTQLSEIMKAHYPDKKIMAINKQADIDELKRLLVPTTQEQPNG